MTMKPTLISILLGAFSGAVVGCALGWLARGWW